MKQQKEINRLIAIRHDLIRKLDHIDTQIMRVKTGKKFEKYKKEIEQKRL